jgi:hypothetical protein
MHQAVDDVLLRRRYSSCVVQTGVVRLHESKQGAYDDSNRFQ